MQTIGLKANPAFYFVLFATLLVVAVVFTKEGGSLFADITSWLGIFWEEVFLVVIVLLIVMMLISTYNINMNVGRNGRPRQLVRQVTVEGFSGAESFCEKYLGKPDLLHEKCQAFNRDSCNATSCCVWLNSEKCVGGNKFGPTYYSDDNLDDIDVNHFHHKNVCRGNCPK
jgi:predicted membrane protein